MSKTKIKVLTICGSGVVTSSMVANQIKDIFGEMGYDVYATEANPSEIENYTMREKFDFIAFASPIVDSCGVPAINAMGLVTGMGKDDFIQKAIDVLKKIGKYPI
ncbi:PTS fructose transporter subunit IIB [Pectinatus frisingensis]|uniref:PTS fructose transporter subunit IIB n=1 Tax=Pectinatus frisingensis TaxID=865 RepID=UPI0015F43AAE|nr:PTS fructose transporter subunit IIB [Pectinatus frisingensis]